MPAGAPEIGEVWELQLLGSDVKESAVITQLPEGRVELISRLGRVLKVSLPSFNHTWRYLRARTLVNCAHEGCSSLGYLQTQSLGRWVWTCKEHIPPGTDALLFAGDPTTQLSKVQSHLTTCPNCGKSLPNKGSGSGRLTPKSQITMHWCGVCFQHWILLIGQNTVWDGTQFLQTLLLISQETQESRLVDLECSLGRSAYRMLRDALNSVAAKDSKSLMGIRLTQSDRFGNNQALILGRLEGVPLQEVLSDSPKSAPELPPCPVHVGSIWWHKADNTSVRVLGTQHDGERFTVDILERGARARKGVDLDEFLRVYKHSPPRLEVSVEELWKSLDGTVVRVTQLNDRDITVVDDNRVYTTVDRHTFQLQFMKIEQKGALERLLGEDPF